jgi:hypothetical protein
MIFDLNDARKEKNSEDQEGSEEDLHLRLAIIVEARV